MTALNIKTPVFRLSAVSMCIMLLAGTAFLLERFYRLSNQDESFAYSFEIGRMLVNFGGMALLSPLIYQTIRLSLKFPGSRVVLWLAGLLMFVLLYILLNKSVLFLISENVQSLNLWTGNRKLLLNFSHILVLFYGATSYGSYQLMKEQPQSKPTKKVKKPFMVSEIDNLLKGIQVDSIEYISTYDHYLKLYQNGNFKLIRLSLSGLQDKLPPQFMQIHRSQVINTHFAERLIRKQGKYFVQMLDGNQLRVSASYLEEVRKRLESGHSTT